MAEEYGALPTNLVAVLTGVAGLILGATAWCLRFLPQPIPFLGALGAEQHRLPLELAGTVIAICGLALLMRGFFPPTYTVTLSKNTWARVKKVVANFSSAVTPTRSAGAEN